MTDVLLTIAGTDPTGAAGIQVDLQVFRDFGFHGASIITAVLWQNTMHVLGMHALSTPQFVAQMRGLSEDIAVSGIKVGLVPTVDMVEMISALLPDDVPVVWDPVLSSGASHHSGELRELMGPSGTELTSPGTVTALRDAVASVDVFTPNAPEASMLVGKPVADRRQAHDAARELVAMGAESVLLKVGHLEGDDAELRDVFADASGSRDLEPLPAIDADVRGTGCQLSSAILAGLVRGDATIDAIESARRYLNELLHERAERIGKGRPVIVRGA